MKILARELQNKQPLTNRKLEVQVKPKDRADTKSIWVQTDPKGLFELSDEYRDLQITTSPGSTGQAPWVLAKEGATLSISIKREARQEQSKERK